MIRVLQVDDHQMVVQAVGRVLAGHSDIELLGSVPGIAQLAAFENGSPDVILMDYTLEDGTGAQATRLAKARWPKSRVVMVTSMTDDDTILESVQAGADGYLTKDRAIDDVIAAVHAAYAGEMLLPAEVLSGMVRRLGEIQDNPMRAALTPRETEILRHLAAGTSTRGMAVELGLSPDTVRTHVQAVRRKLGAHSKLEAVAIALRRRLIDVPSRREEK